MSLPDDTACRLCGGNTGFAYRTVVLGKHEVAYHRCQQCGSLQTQQPYWLDEAYSSATSSIDPGAARRVLDSYVLVHLIARLFGCRKLLDFGGNTGFLCRLLRDHGYDAYCFDRYITPSYAAHFVGSPQQQHDLVTAFEVIEHFAFPHRDLEQLFAPRPRVVLATTELFTGQSADWWYLAPREGQHVFFYSPAAVRLIAARYGYSVSIGAGFILFSREPLSAVQRIAVRILRPRVRRLLGTILLSTRGHGAESDMALLTRRPPAN